MIRIPMKTAMSRWTGFWASWSSVRWTWRNEEVRVISARRATQSEQREYQEE